ncbi:Proteasome subunit beta type-7 [Polyrhizophydium stewartii]|uniref:Proteasome subunit beta n=1 Tax=Polyrhizophydium stewartii TaxID=2732419 RepID=A0ABR4NF23_9FUNG|nr:Proteasome subunit beta type-7 [Polyrhizophydium stewartii]
MDTHPGNWGNPRPHGGSSDLDILRPVDGLAPAPSAAHGSSALPVSRTQQPIVTGTSVLGIKYKDGVMLAADTLASYGSLAQIRDMKRLVAFGDHTVIGASGDMSDWQHIQHILNDCIIDEYANGDGHQLHPAHIFEYTSRVMYGRRSQVNPLWNSLVVGGFRDGKHFLGYVDLLGTTYQSSTIATGYGSYIAQPLLRKQVEGREDELTEADAAKILDESMRVLFYRDARSLNKIQRATINPSGVSITEPYSLQTEWSFAEGIKGYGAIYE